MCNTNGLERSKKIGGKFSFAPIFKLLSVSFKFTLLTLLAVAREGGLDTGTATELFAGIDMFSKLLKIHRDKLGDGNYKSDKDAPNIIISQVSSSDLIVVIVTTVLAAYGPIVIIPGVVATWFGLP